MAILRINSWTAPCPLPFLSGNYFPISHTRRLFASDFSPNGISLQGIIELAAEAPGSLRIDCDKGNYRSIII